MDDRDRLDLLHLLGDVSKSTGARMDRIEARLEALEGEPGIDPVDEVLDRLLDLRPTIHPHMLGGYVWSACVRCNEADVEVDHEGCCLGCGEDATFIGFEPDTPEPKPEVFRLAVCWEEGGGTDVSYHADDATAKRVGMDAIANDAVGFTISPLFAHPEPAMSTDEAERIADATMQDVSPEPGEPKVVGWIHEDFPDAKEWPFSEVRKKPNGPEDIPVILQSEHEAVVRGLRERLHSVAELSGDRQAEVTRLKAENERLREELSEATRQCRHWEKVANDTTITASKQLQERNDEIDRLRKGRDLYREAAQTAMRERDAYADPANWMPLSARYVGPTPSDSTEGESVEGEVLGTKHHRRSLLIHLDHAGQGLIPGTRVHITRLPGGSDGEE